MTQLTTPNLLRHATKLSSRLGGRLGGITGALMLAGTLEGCSGAYWGNLIVLGVSFGIFYGTLSLGRTTPSRIQAESSQLSQRPPAPESNANG